MIQYKQILMICQYICAFQAPFDHPVNIISVETGHKIPQSKSKQMKLCLPLLCIYLPGKRHFALRETFLFLYISSDKQEYYLPGILYCKLWGLKKLL